MSALGLPGEPSISIIPPPARRTGRSLLLRALSAVTAAALLVAPLTAAAHPDTHHRTAAVPPAGAPVVVLADDRIAEQQDLAAAKLAGQTSARATAAQARAEALHNTAIAAQARKARQAPAARAHTSRSSARTAPSRAHRAAATSTVQVGLPAAGAARTVVAFALAQVGDPYQYGSVGPGSWDCSGLVLGAYRQVGVSLPHQSGAIAARGRRVPVGQWAPGDVVSFPGHVALYVGGGMMVEAPHRGARVRVVHTRGGTAHRLLTA